MARRSGGGRGRREVPGLAYALSARARAFGQHWESQRSLDFADALDRGDPVTVDGETVWRALFDQRRPREWEEFMGDAGMYVVTDDLMEPVSH